MNAPAFSLRDQNGRYTSLTNFKGKMVVLYFYPKADTPGCTTQACGLRDNIKTIQALGANVIGISPDEYKDLKKFQEKYDLNFTLLADPETDTAKAYGVWKEKTFMGRRYMGVERTTFLIDGNGQIIKTYEKVNPVTHADTILNDLRNHVMPPPPARETLASKVAVKKVAKKKAPSKAIAKKVVKKSVKKAVKKTAAKKKK